MLLCGCMTVIFGAGWASYQGLAMCVSGVIMLILSFLRVAHYLLLWAVSFLFIFQSLVLFGFGCIDVNLFGFPSVLLIIYIPAYQKKTITPWLEKIILQKETRTWIISIFDKIFK